MSHVIRCQPKTIPELKSMVEDFATNLDKEQILKMARHTKKRSEYCLEENGGHFDRLRYTYDSNN